MWNLHFQNKIINRQCYHIFPFLLHLVIRSIALWGPGGYLSKKTEGTCVPEPPPDESCMRTGSIVIGRLHEPELNLYFLTHWNFEVYLLQHLELPYLTCTGTAGNSIVAERITYNWISSEYNCPALQKLSSTKCKKHQPENLFIFGVWSQ